MLSQNGKDYIMHSENFLTSTDTRFTLMLKMW